MSSRDRRPKRHERFKELLARRAAVQREIRLFDLKILALSQLALRLRRAA
jgi:hypothetical protein